MVLRLPFALLILAASGLFVQSSSSQSSPLQSVGAAKPTPYQESSGDVSIVDPPNRTTVHRGQIVSIEAEVNTFTGDPTRVTLSGTGN